jgi:hypothetical protein
LFKAKGGGVNIMKKRNMLSLEEEITLNENANIQKEEELVLMFSECAWSSPPL